MEAALKLVLPVHTTIRIRWKQIIPAFAVSLILLCLYVGTLYQNSAYSAPELNERFISPGTNPIGEIAIRSDGTSHHITNHTAVLPKLGVAPVFNTDKNANAAETSSKIAAKPSAAESRPPGTSVSSADTDGTFPDTKEPLTNTLIDTPDTSAASPKIPASSPDVATPDITMPDATTPSSGTTAPSPDAGAPTPVLTVIFHGNGGFLNVTQLSVAADDFNLNEYEIPERPGKLFDGWYEDSECQIPFTSLPKGTNTIELYAGWKEFTGFLSNDNGHIIGYTDEALILVDGLIALPSYNTCTGIEKSAFSGLEDDILEIYIPANITYIAPELFDDLNTLMFIEVNADNLSFYSKDGILYYKNSDAAIIPKGRL